MMGENRKKGFWLDPRAKLFLILMCVLASMVAPSLGYQFILVLLIALLGVLFGKWKYAVNAVCFYAVICVLTVWIMTEMTGTLRTMFVAFLGLFHKVYACGMNCLVNNESQRIFISNEPDSCTQKAGYPAGGHAALHSNYSGGLALYQRRYAYAGCFPNASRVS